MIATATLTPSSWSLGARLEALATPMSLFHLRDTKTAYAVFRLAVVQLQGR